ncbi:MAG: hypothetical protein CMD14_02080 [Flavobacteriales bacterium]|nr:hypothetical protein [Flavobacteriales bacterium]|tara:strand:+ start:12808 stop:13761 length:954 start_codon:yes stop_codon:yes gene_type:complete
MKKFLLSVFTLIFLNSGAQNCSDLFISEYCEGTGNNKALEIYNPTNNTIDLSQYIIIRYSNGSTSAGADKAIQLVGSIDPFGVHVGVIEKLNPAGTGNEAPVDPALQLKANAFYCPDYNVSNAWYWNGNDAIVLAKGSVSQIASAEVVDVFGRIGETLIASDGGWTNDPSSDYITTGPNSWTENQTLIRKSQVQTGVVGPNGDGNVAFFDPSLEWDSLPVNSWDSLGSHSCNCANPSSVIGETYHKSFIVYPNPAKQGQIVSVKSNEGVKNITTSNILGEHVSFGNMINTSVLEKGIYILNIQFLDGKHYNTKLILE